MKTDESIDREVRAQLKRTLDKGPSLEDDPVGIVRRRVSTRQRRRRHMRLASGVGVLGMSAIVAMVLLGARSDTENVAVTGTSAPSADSPIPPQGGTTEPPGDGAAGPPLDVRGDAALVWTGSELVVWGGDVEAFNMGLPGPDRAFADGAVFDPATDDWRVMSVSPLPQSAVTPVGVRTDVGVVLARDTSAALWDPETDAWREFEDAPAPLADLAFTGESVISYSANAILDLSSGTWEVLPEPPLQLERPTSVFAEDEFVVIGGPSSPFTQAAAIAYDPNEARWRTLPEPPQGLRAEALSADWDGERIVVVNYDMQAVVYYPREERWDRLPEVPARFSEWYPTLRSVNGYSVAFMASAIVILNEADEWTPVPYASSGPGWVVSDEAERLYVLGVDTETQRNPLAVVVPNDLATTPTQIQAGLYRVDLPRGHTFLGAEFSSGAPQPGENVRIEIRTESGICVVLAGYDTADLIESPVSEKLKGVAWARDESGHAWRIESSSTDSLRIDCDGSDDARKLAVAIAGPSQ